MLKKSLRIPLFFFHGILCALQLEAHEREDHFGRPINVMAQNLYVGADLLHVGNVGSPEEIPIAVVETLQAWTGLALLYYQKGKLYWSK